jgi:spore coat protein A
MNRRRFLKSTALVGTGALMLRGRVWPFAQSPTNIRKFVTTLPGLGPSEANNIGQYLPLATKTTSKFAGISTDVYHLGVKKFDEMMHPDLPRSTHFWGYYDLATGDQQYLGGIIVAKRGTPILLNVTNQLPDKVLIPTDPTVMAGPNGLMVGDLPLNRIVTHLHGGFTPWFSDGTPFQWFDPSGLKGESFMNVPGTKPPRGSANYYYPMDQSARFVWYHDHAMGITRTNAYSGIASGLLIVDDFEINLVNSGLLPDLVGIPLVVQDKSFVAENILDQDPTWQWGKPGDLWYPHAYEANILSSGIPNAKGRWDWGPTVTPPARGTQPLPAPVSLVPEAFFDTILINGGVYPKVSVPPRRVRFQLQNASQARFYHLNLYAESSAVPGEANLKAPGPKIYQVGTEGGFLPAVAVHPNSISCLDLKADSTGNTAKPDGPFNLLLAPAERADVVIDFNGVPANSKFILYNDAPAPFPGGDSRNNYFTGDADQTAIGGAPTTIAGHGPNTQTLMEIIVTAGSGDSLRTPGWLAQMNSHLMANFVTGNQPGLLFNKGYPWEPAFPFDGVADRMLTLNEDFDDYGRLIQTLGTAYSESPNNQGMPTWGLGYLAPTTENPSTGAIEVWQIMNLTSDTHPMHFHLVNVQLIQRQPFTGNPNSWSYTGPPTRPDPNEVGWKDTVRMNPGEVATIIMQFTLPKLPASMGNPLSPRTGGHEYVWHCHILEHEEHDMMRPFVVS